MLKLGKKSIIICLLLVLVLVACRNLKNSPEVKRIDSLKNVLTTINNKIAEIDSQKIAKVFIDYQNNSKQLGMYFNNKKENGVWENITQYDIINIPLSEFKNKRSSYISQVQNSSSQLENLKSDFINRTITKEKFIVFFDQEYKQINALRNQVESSVNQTKDVLALFDTLNPRILIIIAKLKEEKNNSPKTK